MSALVPILLLSPWLAWCLVAPEIPKRYWRTKRGAVAYMRAIGAELVAVDARSVKESYEKARDRWRAVPYGNALDAFIAPWRYYRDRLRYETRWDVLEQVSKEYDEELRRSIDASMAALTVPRPRRSSQKWEVN